MAVILAHPGDPSLVDYQHYVWANMLKFLGAQVATIPLKSVCRTVHILFLKCTDLSSLGMCTISKVSYRISIIKLIPVSYRNDV